ncbi:MAG: hypothetical protein ABNO60_00620 [Candidatus Shikimatogenerans sp. Tcar]|uniref:50S ribosomal protein L24 n=1 Tax=Candidatus Shikimatogenerans sp. Tcar TaxID=3158565 RepID=A0AAU7QSF9_9FLAO
MANIIKIGDNILILSGKYKNKISKIINIYKKNKKVNILNFEKRKFFINKKKKNLLINMNKIIKIKLINSMKK